MAWPGVDNSCILHHDVFESMNPALVRVQRPLVPVLLAADVTVDLLCRGVHVHHLGVAPGVGLVQADLLTDEAAEPAGTQLLYHRLKVNICKQNARYLVKYLSN